MPDHPWKDGEVTKTESGHQSDQSGPIRLPNSEYLRVREQNATFIATSCRHPHGKAAKRDSSEISGLDR